LAALIAGLGEHEPKERLTDDVAHRPEVRADTVLTAAGVRCRYIDPLPYRCPNPDRVEWAGREAEQSVAFATCLVEPSVRAIEEQEIFALDVEHERLRVRRLGPEHIRVEERVEQEAGVGRFRRHAGDPRDVHVSAAAPIEEGEVEVDRLPVARQPGDEALLHRVEVKSLVSISSAYPNDSVSRLRRDPHLRLDSRGDDVSTPRDLERQDALVH
jgi:hypothetical protein